LLFFIGTRKDHRATMKRIVILFAVVCAAAVARADLILQQQITTTGFNGVTTIKVKGGKVRMDLYAGLPEARSMITDLDTGEIIDLLHSQKMYVKAVGQPMKATRPAGTASRAPVPRATGQNQKVGDWDTELYAWSNTRGINGTAWVARNFPDYARIQADLAVLDKIAGADNDATPELNMLPGMVVRSQVTGSGQTITLALISAHETPLDASQFGVPRDYKEMPKVKPLPVTTQNPPPKASGNARVSSTPPTSAGPRPVASPPAPDNSKKPAGNSSTQKVPDW
jgi:Domain of unknown function (DUF4412)